MLVRAFVAAALTLCPPPAPAHTPSHHAAGPRIRHAVAGDANELYSLRARRRFATYLRLRLLEMREAGLERAAEAVERRLGHSVLLPER